MKCENCKKKCSFPVDCLYCKGKHCTRCMHLERHKCSGIESKNNKDLTNLEKKLEYTPTSKYELLCQER